MNQRYDIKGSTVDRKTPQTAMIKKDLNFIKDCKTSKILQIK